MSQSCDTMVVRRKCDGHLFFAKNSDRPLGEVQRLLLLCCNEEDEKKKKNNNAMVVGAHLQWSGDRACLEWAVNDSGVCGGNEAIPTLLVERAEAMQWGMWILAQAMAVGRSAAQVVQCIVEEVRTNGQGKWSCQEHKTYDNAFLAMGAERRSMWSVMDSGVM